MNSRIVFAFLTSLALAPTLHIVAQNAPGALPEDPFLGPKDFAIQIRSAISLRAIICSYSGVGVNFFAPTSTCFGRDGGYRGAIKSLP